jgi:hypothetical protein
MYRAVAESILQAVFIEHLRGGGRIIAKSLVDGR